MNLSFQDVIEKESYSATFKPIWSLNVASLRKTLCVTPPKNMCTTCAPHVRHTSAAPALRLFQNLR